MLEVAVGAVAALAGVALGPYLTGRAEDRRWHRERRQEACTALLRALAALEEPYYLEGERDAPHAANLARLFVDADLAVELVRVHCPHETAQLAAAAVEAFGRVALTSASDEAALEVALADRKRAGDALSAHLRCLLGSEQGRRRVVGR